MKIYLLSIVNKTSEGLKRVPVGLIYLGSSLKNAGYEVYIRQAFEGSPEIQSIFQEISDQRNQILFVGFSVMMGRGILASLALSEKIKNQIGVPIIWGGKFPSSIPDVVLNEKCIDFLGLGECEETIVDFANTIKNGTPIQNISGIAYKLNGNTRFTNNRPPVLELDSLQFDVDLINDWNQFVTHEPNGEITLIDAIQTSRGCPFRCGFCFHSKELVKHQRYHSIDWILSKVIKIKEYTGINSIRFSDDEFWIDADRSIQIIKKLIEINIAMPNSRMRREKLKDHNAIKKFISLGIKNFGFSIEAGTDRILKLMQKGQNTKQIEQTLRLLTDYPSFIAGGGIMLGSPTETKQEMIESIRFALKLYHIHPNFFFSIYTYKPYPDTTFYDLAIKYGFQPPKSLHGWADMETAYSHRYLIQWLKWVNNTEVENIKRAMEYNRILKIGRIFSKSLTKSSILKRILLFPLNIYTICFTKIAEFRLYYWLYLFPIDLFIFNLSKKIKQIIFIYKTNLKKPKKH